MYKRQFIDWSGDLGRFDKGASSILNAFYYGALVTAADLCGEQGNTSKAALYRSRAAALKTAYEKAFWSPALSAYVNSYRDGKQGTSLSQHAQALALLFDLAPVERRRPLVGQMLREDTMQATPYFMFYVLRALDHTGYYKYAPDQMRRWKSMLDRGATTWLEEWANKRSWCHAWSSAPTYELSTRVLGVRPDAPGFKKAVIEPFTAGLEWAKGTVPTPQNGSKIDVARAWSRAKRTACAAARMPMARTQAWRPASAMTSGIGSASGQRSARETAIRCV